MTTRLALKNAGGGRALGTGLAVLGYAGLVAYHRALRQGGATGER